MYLALEGGPPSFTQDFTCPALLRILRSASHDTGLSPALARFPNRFSSNCELWSPTTPACKHAGVGLVRFRSPLLAECFPFLGLLRCFSSPGSLPCGYRSTTSGGFPHSDTSGSSRLHTPDQSFSQYTTSFIGTVRQGIHRLPLSASLFVALPHM